MSDSGIGDVAGRSAQQQMLSQDDALPATTRENKSATRNTSSRGAASNGGKPQQRAVPTPTPGIGAGPGVVNQLDSRPSETPARGGTSSRNPSTARQDANASGGGVAAGATAQSVSVPGASAVTPAQAAPAQQRATGGADRPVDLKHKGIIDHWLSEYEHGGHSKDLAANDVLDFLKGKFNYTEGGFGELEPNEKRYFLARAVPLLNPQQAEALALAVQTDDSVRGIVAEQFRNTALDHARTRSPLLARAFALNFLRAMQKDPHGLGAMVANLPRPEDATVLPLILGTQMLTDHTPAVRSDPRLNDARTLANARNQLLAAINTVDVTPTNRKAIDAVVFAIIEKTSAADMERAPQLAHNLAFAIARERAPTVFGPKGEPTNPVLLTLRLEGVLATRAGAFLLCAEPSDRKLAAIDAVVNDERITGKTLEGSGDPNRHPLVARGTARWIVNNTRDDQGRLIGEPGKATERVARILLSPGFEIIFGGASRERRRLATQVVLMHPEITAADFEKAGDPWHVVAKPVAELYEQEVPHSPPRAANGKYTWKNLIGGLLRKKPTPPKGVTISKDEMAEMEKAARKGGALPAVFLNSDFFAGDKDVEEFANKLLAHAEPKNPPNFVIRLVTCCGREVGGIANFLVLGVQSGTDANGLPKFTYADGEGGIFADTTKASGRNSGELRQPTPVRVSAAEAWREDNTLPPAMSVYRDESGKLIVEKTPAERDTARKVGHTSSQIGMYLVIGAAVVGTDGLASFIFGGIGAGASGYMAYDEAQEIGRMLDRQQSLASRKGVGHVLGFAASLTGAAPFAGGVGMAMAGVEANTARTITRNLARVAIGANGAAVAEQIETVGDEWDSMSQEEKASAFSQTGLAVLMFGHSVTTLKASPAIELPTAKALKAPELTGKRLPAVAGEATPAEQPKMFGPPATPPTTPAIPAPAKPAPAKVAPSKTYDPASAAKPKNNNLAALPGGPKKPPAAPSPKSRPTTVGQDHPKIATVGNDNAGAAAEQQRAKMAANGGRLPPTQPAEPPKPIVSPSEQTAEQGEPRPRRVPRGTDEPANAQIAGKAPADAPQSPLANNKGTTNQPDHTTNAHDPAKPPPDNKTSRRPTDAFTRYPVSAAVSDGELNKLGDVRVTDLNFDQLGKRLETIDRLLNDRRPTDAQKDTLAKLRQVTVAEINVKDTAAQLKRLGTVDELDAKALGKRSAHLNELANNQYITDEQKAEIARLLAATDAEIARRPPTAAPSSPPATDQKPTKQPDHTTNTHDPAKPPDNKTSHRPTDAFTRYPVSAAVSDGELNDLGNVRVTDLNFDQLGKRLETIDRLLNQRRPTDAQKDTLAKLRQATVAEINVKDTAAQLTRLGTIDVTKLDAKALGKRSAHLNELANNQYITDEQKAEIARLLAATDAEIARRGSSSASTPTPAAQTPPATEPKAQAGPGDGKSATNAGEPNKGGDGNGGKGGGPDGPSGPGGGEPTARPVAPKMVLLKNTHKLVTLVRDVISRHANSYADVLKFNTALKNWIDQVANRQWIHGRQIPSTSTLSYAEFLAIVHECAVEAFGEQVADRVSSDLGEAIKQNSDLNPINADDALLLEVLSILTIDPPPRPPSGPAPGTSGPSGGTPPASPPNPVSTGPAAPRPQPSASAPSANSPPDPLKTLRDKADAALNAVDAARDRNAPPEEIARLEGEAYRSLVEAERAEAPSKNEAPSADHSAAADAHSPVPTEANIAKLRKELETLRERLHQARLAYEHASPANAEHLLAEFVKAGADFDATDARLTEALRAREQAATSSQGSEAPPSAQPSESGPRIEVIETPERVAELERLVQAAQRAFNDALARGARPDERQRLWDEWQRATEAYESAQEKLWDARPELLTAEQLSDRLNRLRERVGSALSASEHRTAMHEYEQMLARAKAKAEQVMREIGALVGQQINRGAENSGAIADKLKLYDNLTGHLMATNAELPLEPASASSGAAKMAAYVHLEMVRIRGEQTIGSRPATNEVVANLQKLHNFLKQESAKERPQPAAPAPATPSSQPAAAQSPEELASRLDDLRAQRARAIADAEAHPQDGAEAAKALRVVEDYVRALSDASEAADRLAKKIISQVQGVSDPATLEQNLTTYDRLTKHLKSPDPSGVLSPANAHDGAAKVAEILGTIIKMAERTAGAAPDQPTRDGIDVLKKSLAVLHGLAENPDAN